MGESKEAFRGRADPPAEVESIRQQLSKALRENRKLKAQVGDDVRLFEAIKDEIVALEPLKPQPIPKPKLDHAPMEAALFLADAHSEEVVRPEEIEGLAEYNWDIFEARMRLVADKTVELVNIMRQASEIRRLWIVKLGDWFLGEIHPDDTAWGSSMPLPVALPKAARVDADLTRRLAAHFDEVVSVGMVGNHGRNTRKKTYKMTADRNWDYALYMISREFTAEIENVRWIIPQSVIHVESVMGWRCAFLHGDVCNVTHRTPYFGIEDSIKREHDSRRRTDRDFDYAFMGHWHHEATLRGEIIMCPALIGRNQFGQYKMHAPSKAQQRLSFFTGKYGKTWDCLINL